MPVPEAPTHLKISRLFLRNRSHPAASPLCSVSVALSIEAVELSTRPRSGTESRAVKSALAPPRPVAGISPALIWFWDDDTPIRLLGKDGLGKPLSFPDGLQMRVELKRTRPTSIGRARGPSLVNRGDLR